MSYQELLKYLDEKIRLEKEADLLMQESNMRRAGYYTDTMPVQNTLTSYDIYNPPAIDYSSELLNLLSSKNIFTSEDALKIYGFLINEAPPVDENLYTRELVDNFSFYEERIKQAKKESASGGSSTRSSQFLKQIKKYDINRIE